MIFNLYMKYIPEKVEKTPTTRLSSLLVTTVTGKSYTTKAPNGAFVSENKGLFFELFLVELNAVGKCLFCFFGSFEAVDGNDGGVFFEHFEGFKEVFELL